MTVQPHRTDTAPSAQVEVPRVRTTVRDITPSAPAPVRPETPDPSGFGFARPAVQRAPASAPARRPARAPQGPPRWPHIAVAIIGPAAGVAGFLAAVLSSTLPIRILTYVVIGGLVIVKVARARRHRRDRRGARQDRVPMRAQTNERTNTPRRGRPLVFVQYTDPCRGVRSFVRHTRGDHDV